MSRYTKDYMKPIIRCRNCSIAHYAYEPGFTGRVYLVCNERNIEVADDDGCTFGVKGEHGTLKADCEVFIDSQAAVNGFAEDW